ncbi:peptidylprolyl isomerase [Paenibacillus sp. KQZ6P-2]|uniref:Peptidylprolyl isomerase n=1 Tax=Paenibacillus mangrovi TaxID=2931978 RepID=A0A9X2B4V4_9BACL|nr:peptidylprolyl isomerase [Paenibacillus mangrovi]MCJ8015074.1 peptidylprolyl isomerase [Paenibacillus mangrovi]
MLFNNKKAWKGVILTLITIMAVSMLAGCEKSESADKQDSSKVVATYKGGQITEKELETQKRIISFMSPDYAQLVNMNEFQDYLVKQMIAFQYLSDKASDAAKKEGEKQATQVLDMNKKQMGDKEFQKALDNAKLNEDDLNQYLVQTMTAMSDMTSKVTEEEIKNKYEETKQDYTVASLHHILIGLQYGDKKERTKEEALKIAKDVKSQLDQGADFGEMAKKYSDDTATKDNGGEYKNFTLGQTGVSEFKEKVLSLPLNQISDPFESTLGYHIVKVDSREETPYDKLTADQKNSIKQNLGAAKIDNFMQNDLKNIIQKIDLPKSTEAPAEGTGKDKSSTEGTNGTNKEDVNKTEGTSGK